MNFELTDEPINPIALRERMLSPKAGAYCSYEGWVRDLNEGKSVSELHYSSYPQLAPKVANAILEEAKEKFAIQDAAIVHRHGPLKTGEIAVWVGVTAHHRDAVFHACRYIIDEVKFRLPVWKKEIYDDGSSAWIENHMCGCSDASHHKDHHEH